MCQEQKRSLHEENQHFEVFAFAFVGCRRFASVQPLQSASPPDPLAKAAQGLGQREYRHAHTSYFILKTYFRDTCVRPVHMSADVTEARRG